ncbi:MAG: hypothetical protein M1511_13330 [Deltaproteobacteria bacterium]|nr:hypothetical protein [Deltaproteobacteria bacterium]
MRYFLVSLLCVAALFAFYSNSMAVGVYTPGKELCDCSPFVQRGVIPDTWNKLTQALLIPQICWAIDRFTIEAKAVINQFGQPPETAEVSTAKEIRELKDEPPPLEKEKVKKAVEKKKKTTVRPKHISKKKKNGNTKNSKPVKKRIKAPQKAL